MPPESYDLRGLKCPLPALRAKKRLASMAPGSKLWVLTSDPLAVIDIPAFCSNEDHALLKQEQTDYGHRFLIKRGPVTR